jgi:transaldolase
MNTPTSQERNFQTNIFLDSGDPADTKRALELFPQLSGQTTNPSLVAKNEELKKVVAEKGALSTEELLDFYKNIIGEVSEILPNGAISIEVYADVDTTADDMVAQARQFVAWMDNPYIKLPITTAGLEAAETLSKDGVRLNMTLNFSPEQAYAVYLATISSKPGDVFISPFLGRLDDVNVCGVTLVATILDIYAQLGSHVEVLAASIRNIDHIYACLQLGVHDMTIPLKHLEPWVEQGVNIPEGFVYNCGELAQVTYELPEEDVTDWRDLNIQHDLTDRGLAKFAADWNALLGK